MLNIVTHKLKDLFSFLAKDQLDKSLDYYVRFHNPLIQIQQKQVYAFYKSMTKAGRLYENLSDAGYRVYSQFDEDGILLYLFAVLGEHNKTFVDIGAHDGINSNCANLAINFGWTGLFIDGDKKAIERGKKFYETHQNTYLFPPQFIHSMVTRENINKIIKNAGFNGSVDLVSIDIDGNDYWVWDALTIIDPTVVIIETHVEFGLKPIVVPYNKDYVYPGKHPQYHGASITAMNKLAKKKGYVLVGSNLYGFNTIYVKKDKINKCIPTVTPKEILARHPRNKERVKLFDEIKDFTYLKV